MLLSPARPAGPGPQGGRAAAPCYRKEGLLAASIPSFAEGVRHLTIAGVVPHPSVSQRQDLAPWGPSLHGPEAAAQLTAFRTRAAIISSTADVHRFTANEVGHMSPSSRLAVSLNPTVEYLEPNLAAP